MHGCCAKLQTLANIVGNLALGHELTLCAVRAVLYLLLLHSEAFEVRQCRGNPIGGCVALCLLVGELVLVFEAMGA